MNDEPSSSEQEDRERQDQEREAERVEARVYRPPYPEADREAEEISLLELVNVLLRHRWKVLGLPVVAALVVVGFTVLSPPSYTADASFMPQLGTGGGQLSRLSGVASQFGIDVPSGEAGASPQFYADLVTSRRILSSAVGTEYVVVREGDTIRGDLVEIWEIEAETEARAREAAIGALEERISVSTGTETGMVELSVTTGSPVLSKQVADRLIELVNQFNLEVRQSQAAAQAEFVGERLEKARAELRAAEDSLERFLENNRRFQNSPTLRFEHQRLQRRVSLKEQVVSSLATRYEEAQINEVRNTPVITVVTPPDLPATPDPDRLPLKGVLGLLLGGMVGVFWAFGAEFGRSAREEGREDYREFRSLREEAARDLRRVGRRIRRLGDGRDEEG